MLLSITIISVLIVLSFFVDIYLQLMYNCLVGAGGICRFIKINKNKKNNFIDVNFIHSLKAPLVTRPLPDRYHFVNINLIVSEAFQ